MNKDEQLQRLLRLKRHEQPPEGFAEEFLGKFQRRQRTELVRRSALSILSDRLQAWLEGLRRPAVIWGAVAVYAALMLTLWLVPRQTPPNGVTMLIGKETSSTATVDFKSGTPTSTNGGAKITPLPNYPGPGKRRTTDQPQDKEPIIGPEAESGKKPGGTTEPPLREL